MRRCLTAAKSIFVKVLTAGPTVGVTREGATSLCLKKEPGASLLARSVAATSIKVTNIVLLKPGESS